MIDMDMLLSARRMLNEATVPADVRDIDAGTYSFVTALDPDERLRGYTPAGPRNRHERRRARAA